MPIFLLQSTVFWPLVLLDCKKMRREREGKRESYRLGLWDNQFALPLFVLLSVSHTVSTAVHIFDPLHCLFSKH